MLYPLHDESIFIEDKAFAPGDDVVEDMRFLTEKRTDFSAGGWRNLIPGGEVVVERLEGSHHSSMMQGDAVRETTSFIGRAMREDERVRTKFLVGGL